MIVSLLVSCSFLPSSMLHHYLRSCCCCAVCLPFQAHDSVDHNIRYGVKRREKWFLFFVHSSERAIDQQPGWKSEMVQRIIVVKCGQSQSQSGVVSKRRRTVATVIARLNDENGDAAHIEARACVRRCVCGLNVQFHTRFMWVVGTFVLSCNVTQVLQGEVNFFKYFAVLYLVRF